MDVFVVAAFALLALGVAGSFLPVLPSGILSLAGVVLYWWHTGDPGPLLFAALVGIGVLATLVDWLAGFIGARAGGTDTRTSVAAGAVGFLGMVVGGPVGLLAGVAGTVFVLQFSDTRDIEQSVRRAGYATVGVLASAAMQAVLTVTMLAAVAWVQFV